jgi:hypothetical protein
MKTSLQLSTFTPTIAVLVLLAAVIVFIGAAGKKVPLLSNIRLDIILLVVIGMAICQQGGIGRVAATGEWLHPLSILGYVLGGLILLITLAVFAGWSLPWIRNDQQALLVISLLACFKILNAIAHEWITI